MSLQLAWRTTAADFETVALSRQTVLTRIISQEVSYAAGLQSEIRLPFFLNTPFSFCISFWVFMAFFLFGLVSLITYWMIQNKKMKAFPLLGQQSPQRQTSAARKSPQMDNETLTEKCIVFVMHTFKSLGCCFKCMQTSFSKFFNSRQVLQIPFQKKKSKIQNVTYSCFENWQL